MGVVSFSGLASGIDGDAIIKAITDARRIANKPLENKITRNDDETKALEEFNTRLLSLNDAVKDFRTLAGGAIAKRAVSSNENAVTAVAGSSAPAGSTTIEVLKLARGGTLSFSDRFSSIDDPVAPGLSGPALMTVTVGIGETQKVIEVEVDGATSLAQLTTKINEAAGGSVVASSINAGTEADPQFILVLNSTETGTAKGTIAVDVSPELANQGVFQTPTVSQAEDALLNVQGIGQVSRATNLISDLLPGVTIDLKSAGSGPVTVSVSNDSTKTGQKLSEVIGAFNALITYSNENDIVERIEDDSGVTNKFGTLARTRVDDQAISALKAAIAEARSGIEGSQIQIFADLGVTTARDGTLAFDESKFNEAIAKDYTAVNNVLQSFADRIGTTNGVIDQYTKFEGFIDSSVNANKSENDKLNERLQRLERSIEQQTATMQKIFSNLETQMSRLNSDAAALTSMLSSIQVNNNR